MDRALAKKEAEELYRAGEKKIGTDESAFLKIMALRHFYQLRATFEEYARVSGRITDSRWCVAVSPRHQRDSFVCTSGLYSVHGNFLSLPMVICGSRRMSPCSLHPALYFHVLVFAVISLIIEHYHIDCLFK